MPLHRLLSLDLHMSDVMVNSMLIQRTLLQNYSNQLNEYHLDTLLSIGEDIAQSKPLCSALHVLFQVQTVPNRLSKLQMSLAEPPTKKLRSSHSKLPSAIQKGGNSELG